MGRRPCFNINMTSEAYNICSFLLNIVIMIMKAWLVELSSGIKLGMVLIEWRLSELMVFPSVEGLVDLLHSEL